MTTRHLKTAGLTAALLSFVALVIAPAVHALTAPTAAPTPAAAVAAPATAPRAGEVGGTVVNITFAVQLANTSKVLQTMGSSQYGVSFLSGRATISGVRVSVQRMSVTQYINGTGPIGGFLTLAWPTGEKLGFSVTGQSQPIGSQTRIVGNLRLIGSTGRWAGYSGIGTMSALRVGAIGTPVVYKFALILTK